VEKMHPHTQEASHSALTMTKTVRGTPHTKSSNSQATKLIVKILKLELKNFELASFMILLKDC